VFLDHAGALVLLNVGGDDTGAFPYEEVCGSPANAGGRSGNQCHFTLQPTGHAETSRLLSRVRLTRSVQWF
jgi:hypothetical protein